MVAAGVGCGSRSGRQDAKPARASADGSGAASRGARNSAHVKGAQQVLTLGRVACEQLGIGHLRHGCAATSGS